MLVLHIFHKNVFLHVQDTCFLGKSKILQDFCMVWHLLTTLVPKMNCFNCLAVIHFFPVNVKGLSGGVQCLIKLTTAMPGCCKEESSFLESQHSHSHPPQPNAFARKKITAIVMPLPSLLHSHRLH